MFTNTAVANNLTTRTANLSNGDAGGGVRYLQNTFVDYQVLCLDPWNKVNYRLTLILGDDDTIDTASNSSIDEIYDWGN